MTTLTLRGDQLGEALQFNGGGNTVAVEIGQVWFSASDTVQITFAPAAFDPVTGALVAGAGGIIGLTVTTATGLVTTFGVSAATALDIDPDQSKNGGDFFYISESPAAGIGGAYAGLQLEKIVVADTSLVAGTSPILSLLGGYVPSPIVPVDPVPVLPETTVAQPAPYTLGAPTVVISGTTADDVMTGTAGREQLLGQSGNDRIVGLGGADNLSGGDGNDIMNGGIGRDRLDGGDGNDLLWGAAGADLLAGGAGDDILDGGAGGDVLTGGFGGDTFVFGNGDVIKDFNIGEGDMIAFAAALNVDPARVIQIQTQTGLELGIEGKPARILLEGFQGTLDLGSDVVFDYVPTFDFL